MNKSNQRGFTVLEVLIVAASISLLGIVFFWASKCALFVSQETLLNTWVKELNSRIEIYEIQHPNQKPWKDKEEALSALFKNKTGEIHSSKYNEMLIWSPSQNCFSLNLESKQKNEKK